MSQKFFCDCCKKEIRRDEGSRISIMENQKLLRGPYDFCEKCVPKFVDTLVYFCNGTVKESEEKYKGYPRNRSPLMMPERDE